MILQDLADLPEVWVSLLGHGLAARTRQDDMSCTAARTESCTVRLYIQISEQIVINSSWILHDVAQMYRFGEMLLRICRKISFGKPLI